MSGIIYYMLSRQIPVEYRSLGTGRDFRVAHLSVGENVPDPFLLLHLSYIGDADFHRIGG